MKFNQKKKKIIIPKNVQKLKYFHNLNIAYAITRKPTKGYERKLKN